MSKYEHPMRVDSIGYVPTRMFCHVEVSLLSLTPNEREPTIQEVCDIIDIAWIDREVSRAVSERY